MLPPCARARSGRESPVTLPPCSLCLVDEVLDLERKRATVDPIQPKEGPMGTFVEHR
jgi:hypothetical protein